jgi:uncharacterized protein (TIGR03435 family)
MPIALAATARITVATLAACGEAPAYALVVGKSGPKRQQVKPGGTTRNTDDSNNGSNNGGNNDTKNAAETLAGIVEHPVVDQTGLQGVYHLRLEYPPENAKSGGPDGAAGTFIDTALQEQLGLKLQTQKLPVEIAAHVSRRQAGRLVAHCAEAKKLSELRTMSFAVSS